MIRRLEMVLELLHSLGASCNVESRPLMGLVPGIYLVVGKGRVQSACRLKQDHVNNTTV
jgi:hypothetical protein